MTAAYAGCLHAISRLGLIWHGLSNQLAVAAAPALEAVANAMAAMASRTGPLGTAIAVLFDNIGRLTTYAATFAAMLAGRWVAGMAAAALSVRGLATALMVMRGALIPDLDLRQIENRFAGAAEGAATAAKVAFDRAFADNPLSVPDLGLTGMADAGRARAAASRTDAYDLAVRATGRPSRRGLRRPGFVPDILEGHGWLVQVDPGTVVYGAARAQ
jgi:hypothetical protein